MENRKKIVTGQVPRKEPSFRHAFGRNRGFDRSDSVDINDPGLRQAGMTARKPKQLQKIQTLCVMVLLWSSQADYVSAARPPKPEDLSNMIIHGNNRLRVHGQATESLWSPDIYKNISDFMQEDAMIGALKPPAIKQPPLLLPDETVSEKTAMPWLSYISESPILSLAVKPQREKKQVDWILFIKDSQGNMFYELRKNGVMPSKVEWDGFAKNGQPLQVGFDYNFSLSIVDEAGNPQRISGNPFKVDCFRYTRGGKIITSIHPGALFQDEASHKFSRQGFNYLTEMKDFLRGNFGKKVEVIVGEDDENFGRVRADAIRGYLMKALDYPESKIMARVISVKEADGYKHVDIIAK